MFKIGDFSNLTRVSIRMLRYYDEMGLFKPGKVDDFTGYRYYSASQIPMLNFIVSLRNMGFNVADIMDVIKTKSDKDMETMLKAKKEEIQNSIRAEQEKIIKIDSAISNLKKERVNMDYNVVLKSVPSYKVISLRDNISCYEDEGMLWRRLVEYVQKKNISWHGNAFAIYHDEGYKEGQVDVEVVMSVDKLCENEDGFIFKETEPLSMCASVLVIGDYSNITPAYNYLGKWIEENRYTICGNARQYTIKGHWNENNTDNYLSEIQIPVKKL